MKYFWKIPAFNHKEIFEQIIDNRKYTKEQLEQFLKPNFFKDQGDPRAMGGMKKSILRIKKALDNNEKIGIFCDYDADGIPAGAILFKAFSKYNKNIFVFIPKRSDGYGISEKSFNFFSENECSLVVAVDAGITAKKIAEVFKQKSIDLIIIDHHIVIKDQFPKDAYAVIDPKKESEKYFYKDFSAGGLAWKLIYALHLEYKIYSELEIKWMLDLVAISTISDIVPLTGENWLLAKYGLIVISKTKNIGLKELIKISSIDVDNVNEYNIGFQIGPRLNASGRMADPIDSFNLLTNNDPKIVKKLAENLDKNNRLRQLQMQQAFDEAIVKIEKSNLYTNKVIIIKDQKWQEGILGLVASKIVEKYNLPAIVFKEKKDILIGSARSVKGFNIENAFERNKNNITSFGGHKMAAGLRLEKNRFKNFKKEMTTFALANINDNMLIKYINIDAVAEDINNVNLELFNKIQKLKPFGEENKEPIIMLKNINISDSRIIGKENNHLSFIINNKIRAINFNYNSNEKIDNKKLYDICGNITLNTWGGQKKVEIKIKDLRQSSEAVSA